MFKHNGWRKTGMAVALVILVAAMAVSAVGARGRGPRHRGVHFVELLAEATGFDMADIKAELEAGKTLAEVADENGADIDALIETALDDMQARLDEAVAEGRITQAEADDMLADAAERLAERVNEVIDFSALPQRKGRHGGPDAPGGGNGAGQPQDGQGA